MFKFFNETNRKSEGGDLEAIPNDNDLNSLRKMIYTFFEQPKHYLIDEYTQKRLCLYRDITQNSGFVYYGYVGSANPSEGFVPHGYGEFAYRSAIMGCVFYAGYFHLGIPSGDCRFSINSKRGCYGVMRGSVLDREFVIDRTTNSYVLKKLKEGYYKLNFTFYPHD